MDTPKYYEFINPTLQALREGGGSLTQREMVEAVARILHLSEEVMERRHARFAMVRDYDYCLAWAQAYLKQVGYLTQTAQGVWVLTPDGNAIDAGDAPMDVVEGMRWSGDGGTDPSGLY
jgi:restriction endonuclease Mrr